MSLQSFLQLFGGVAVLIYGIKIMGEALQEIAGDKLRRLIASWTGTPAKGIAVGALVTTIIQSSSATTIMVVSFVDVGLMTLAQAVGVIMGANIGTTMTAQLMAFSIEKYAILGAIVGIILLMAAKKKRNVQIGSCLMGFSLLFIGMAMMKNSMGIFVGREDLFLIINDNLFYAVLAGTFVTMLVQSSSATVGLTIAMAVKGLISLPIAVALICGDNIGTTITAVLASLGGNRAAKQAATAHVLFNVVGSIVLFSIFGPFIKLVKTLDPVNIGHQVAHAHTLFNVVNTCIFFPFVKPYARFVQWLVPNREGNSDKEAQYLDKQLIERAPAAAVDAVRKEMIRLGKIAYTMLVGCRAAIIDHDGKEIDSLFSTEKAINSLTHDIVQYSTELGQKRLAPDLSLLLSAFVAGVSDIERMGDHAENLLELYQFLDERQLLWTETARKECAELFDLVLSATSMCLDALETENIDLARSVQALEAQIDERERTLRFTHIERLSVGECKASTGIVFIDVLSNLERIGDHANNLAYIVFDLEKIRQKQV